MLLRTSTWSFSIFLSPSMCLDWKSSLKSCPFSPICLCNQLFRNILLLELWFNTVKVYFLPKWFQLWPFGALSGWHLCLPVYLHIFFGRQVGWCFSTIIYSGTPNIILYFSLPRPEITHSRTLVWFLGYEKYLFLNLLIW